MFIGCVGFPALWSKRREDESKRPTSTGPFSGYHIFPPKPPCPRYGKPKYDGIMSQAVVFDPETICVCSMEEPPGEAR